MNKSQLKIFLFMLIISAAAPLFAQNGGDLGSLGLDNLESFAKNVQGIFGGTLVRVILICCLCGCGIAYAFNKDNEKMKRNVIAIGIGVIIVGVATELVGAFFKAAGKS
ncbi:MAG: TrbC/VirB2 family protein [Treponema sp.]|jgi:type IV secretory pathway VirB2 component (pilin)|nr:TrbC/VirB2 family protein [Treponema sp.]